VFVVEGAYKAAPLIATGLLATAAPFHQWSPECVEALAGRHLVYLADHDHPDANGKRSSERLAADARAKLALPAASFRIVPAKALWESLGCAGEPPHGYDVRDWMEADGTAARLIALCAAIPDGRAGSRLVMVKASSVVARAVPWMWPGHLERGALELLAGVPGLGKSQVQIHYVACATTTRDWPDGAKSGAPCDAVMMTAEDQLASAMVPRLIAAGADLERVHFMQAIRRDAKTDAMFLLGEDLAELMAYLRDHPAVGIVTIDPITAYLGHAKGFDSHRATDVRSQLGPLKDAAERTGVVFSAVTHPPKSAGPNAVDHFIGSQAFIAAARKGHLCVPEMAVNDDGVPRPTGRVFFADAKRNQGKRAPTLVYKVDEVDTGTIDPETDERIRAPVLVWGTPEDITIEEVLAGARPSSARANAPLQAQKFLMELLATGPASARKIAIDGAAAGHGIEQLDRLRRKLGIVVFDHVTDGRMWSLPEHAPPPDDIAEDGF
jgi:putative DNA primase/helicase